MDLVFENRLPPFLFLQLDNTLLLPYLLFLMNSKFDFIISFFAQKSIL